MARIRTVKPELPSDARLAQVEIAARYTFVCLITQADDDGLLLGNDRQLLGALYPHDAEISASMLRGWLNALERNGQICMRETMDGSPVVQIINWERHQKISHKGMSLIRPRLKGEGAGPSDASSGVPPEARLSVSGPDRGPWTVDQQPTTEEQQPAASAVLSPVLRLTIAANRAANAKWPTSTQPYVSNGKHALNLLNDLDAAAVPIEFAEQQFAVIVARVTDRPNNQRYFAKAIIQAWHEHQARTDAGPVTVAGGWASEMRRAGERVQQQLDRERAAAGSR